MVVYIGSVGHWLLSMAVYIGSVGAQYVINGGLYRQCRGEWKLARVALTMSAGDRLWVARLVLRATFQSPLQLRGVVQGVINGGLYSYAVLHMVLSKAVYTGSVGAQDVINGGLYRQGMGTWCYQYGLYRQCRGEWKLARVASMGACCGLRGCL